MNRDFKGIWIPREIWLMKNLSIQAKALWAEIWSLHDRESGGCFASNEYLCDFMGIKLSRLKEITKELKDADLLIDVSFDGRHRVFRAKVPEADYGGQQPAGIPASSQPVFRPPPGQDSGRPSIYRDTSIDKRLVLPPNPQPKKAASAGVDVKEKTSSQKSDSESKPFSDAVLSLCAKILAMLQSYNSAYRPPRDLRSFRTTVHLMLEIDNHEADTILKTLEWALKDNQKTDNWDGWYAAIFSKSPMETLRRNFAKINAKINSYEKRTSKFAAYSRPDVLKEMADQLMDGAI